MIAGDDRDMVGQLLSIDQSDGVVRTAQGVVMLVQLNLLCQMPK